VSNLMGSLLEREDYDRETHYRLICLSSLWKLYIWDSCNELSRTCNSPIILSVRVPRFSRWDLQTTYFFFCRADFDSIRVFKEGLDWFAEVSGLRLNVQKSHLIISHLAQELKNQMLEFLGFQEGHLPMRYLGLPLISSRLSISDCQPLISKIDARITGWEGISLSYVGRVQIIKSVLSVLSLYCASAFTLPKKVINEIEKRLRNFLWKGMTSSGYAKVAGKMCVDQQMRGDLGSRTSLP
ncbi:UNVERIFIED_CONTAM: hypothetical protein Sindi_0951000, partial [Sesamum indicum]